MLDDDKNICQGPSDLWGTASPRDTPNQIYLSVALGLSAFVAFCVRRALAQGISND